MKRKNKPIRRPDAVQPLPLPADAGEIAFAHGVSRRVVVVDAAESPLFEQIIYIVRDDAASGGITAADLVQQARDAVGRVPAVPAPRPRQKSYTGLLIWLFSVAGVLAAGIFDSLAKLPEVVHNTQIESYQDCTLEKYICTVNSRAIYEFLMGEGSRVYDQGLASGRFTDVILTNLLHTSVVSGFSCGVNQLALAHGLYDFLRRSFTAQAAHLLHGEIVAVGILMQLKFNRMADAYVLGVRRLMAHMQLPTRLPDLGFEPTPENLQLLVDYLLPATGLSPADEPRLRAAIAEIC